MRAVSALWVLAACATPELDSAPDEPLRFGFPLVERHLILRPAMGMDHDPEPYEGAWQVVCTNYWGDPWPHCYDGHSGTDFTLIDSFETMDAGSATIVAAAPGVVIHSEDGGYDRCHGDPETFGVTCDGHELRPNGVMVEHEGGWTTRYWHMMTDTVAVDVGDRVERGTVLGVVGSSGWSTMPHLHFGLESPDGVDVDPYAGPFSQETSWWCDQRGPDDLPGDCDS